MRIYHMRYKNIAVLVCCIIAIVMMVHIVEHVNFHAAEYWRDVYNIHTVNPYTAVLETVVNNDTATSKDRMCPPIPPGITNKTNRISNSDLQYMIQNLKDSLPNVEKGGHYKPTECVARSKIAIIIPMRDRGEHVKIFVNYMHPFLQRQQLEYTIYVVEQDQTLKFNKASMMNVGFLESLNGNHDCVIFHDVDFIPENEINLYTCPKYPRHLTEAVYDDSTRRKYGPVTFGGAIAMSKEHFRAVNGFSNKFFGWGGEDDEMLLRLVKNNIPLERLPDTIGRYRALPHKKSSGFSYMKYLKDRTSSNWEKDGMSSVRYKLLKSEKRNLYTYFLVSLIISPGMYI